MRKFLVLLLVAVLAVSSITACSRKAVEGPKGLTASPPSSSAAGPLFKDTVTFSMMTSSNVAVWPYNAEWWVWKAIEKAANIKIDMTAVPNANYVDKLTLTIASGNIPDLIYTNNYELRNKFAAVGAFVEITKNINEKSMPYFSKFYNTSKENQAWVKRFVSGDGKLYAVPNHGMGEANRSSFMYREDVFKKNNLAVPKTFDELYIVSKKLKEIYPDSYPLVFTNMFLENFMSKMNLMANEWNSGYRFYFDNKVSAWKFGPADASFKEMIMWMNKMYKEKLVPLDLITLQSQQEEELITRSKSFIGIHYISRIPAYNNGGRAVDKDFTMKFMPPPVGGKDGKAKFEFTAAGNATMVISSTSKKIDQAIKYLDWLYSDEAAELVSWGKEGETYKVVNGKREWIKISSDDRIQTMYGLMTEGTYLRFKGSEIMAVGQEKEYLEALSEGPKYDDIPEPIVAFNDVEMKVANNEGAAIGKYVDQEITKFITGAKDFSEWDKFNDEVKKLGLDKVLKIYNDSYARSK